MADISKITLPSGVTYDIKDPIAREAAVGGVKYAGITTTALTDGASISEIVVGGQTVEAINGMLAIYNKKEFIYSTADNKWHEMGDMSELGNMAYADTASASYKPVGVVSTPTISISTAGASTTIKDPTAATVVTDMSVSAPNSTTATGELVYFEMGTGADSETLILKKIIETTGDSITTTNVTVKTGDASYESSQPTFTGTTGTITVSPD